MAVRGPDWAIGLLARLRDVLLGPPIADGEILSYLAASEVWINRTQAELGIVSFTDEAAQDAIGAALLDTVTLDLVYNDVANQISGNVLDSPLLGGQSSAFHLARANHTGSQLAATISDFAEVAQDAVGTILTNGGGLTWTYNDIANLISAVVAITSGAITDFSEAVDDRVAALIQNGTGLAWTYNDVANTLTGNVSITQYTDEMAQDAVGTILVDSATIDFTYNDAANTISASVIPGAASIDDAFILFMSS